MKRVALTQHTVRCPLDDRAAAVTVRTDPDGYPSRRHLEVAACSLLSSTSVEPSARCSHFPDLAPLVPYACDVAPTPRHPLRVSCPSPCLAVLNAAEPGAAGSAPWASGVEDALELARQTQSASMMRILWFFGG
jgi:hypothetical protein